MFKKKQVLNIFLVFVLLFSFSSMSYSQQDNKVSEHNIKVSEYQYLKKLQSKSVNELRKMGFDNDEIKEINEFDYAKVLRERAKLSKEELKKLGYNDEQINIFENFTGTEEEMIALSADLDYNFYVLVSGKDKTTPYSYITLYFDFEWSSSPVWLLSDAIAIAWSDGMKVNMNGTYYSVNYVGGAVSYDWDVPLDVTPGTGITAKWGLSDSITGSWAKSGEGTFAINKYEYLNDVEIVFKYAHGIIIPNLSVSIDGTPSVGFSGSYIIEVNEYLRNYFN